MSRVSQAGVALAMLLSISASQAAVVESFDSGSWSTGWSDGGTQAGLVTTAAAHDGQYGVELNGGNWTYNTDISFAPGQILSAWVRPTAPQSWNGGRFYLGFGADSTGTDSFVGAVNTGDIRFQHNVSFGFTELNTSAQSWSYDWYLMSVTWNTDGTAIGKLFASDGTTLLNSVTQDGLTRTGRGIALRGFYGFQVDTVSVASAVPEPTSLALLLSGGVIAGFAVRRKQS